MKIEMIQLEHKERSRTYTFPNGETVTINDVVAICVSKSGTHRLKDIHGMHYVVPTGWLLITLDIDEWSL